MILYIIILVSYIFYNSSASIVHLDSTSIDYEYILLDMNDNVLEKQTMTLNIIQTKDINDVILEQKLSFPDVTFQKSLKEPFKMKYLFDMDQYSKYGLKYCCTKNAIISKVKPDDTRNIYTLIQRSNSNTYENIYFQYEMSIFNPFISYVYGIYSYTSECINFNSNMDKDTYSEEEDTEEYITNG